MEKASRDFDSFIGRVVSRGLEGLMIRCVLKTQGFMGDKATFAVYEQGQGSPVLWEVSIERAREHGNRDIVGELRRSLRKDRRKEPRA